MAAFTSEWWPPSFRNGGRLQAGIPGRIESESARVAHEADVPRHIGRGLNVWSTVHVEDAAGLYLLALERAEPGSFLFVENGESSFKALAEAIGRALQLPRPAEPWPFEAAAAALGEARARTTFGSNSRVRARRAREGLGWRPHHASAVAWIEQNLDPGA